MQQAALDLINLYQCDHGFATGERVFDFPYLLYVHKGKGVYRIGTVDYTGTIGDLFFCPAGVGNTILADWEDPFLLSGIDFRFTGGGQAAGNPATALPAKLNLLPHPFLVMLINQMVTEFKDGRIHSGGICDHLLSALVLELARLGRAGLPGTGNVQLSMLEYLRSNTGRTIGNAEMSKAFSYHKSSVNRIVTAATGMSPREYQISARIKTAAELLAYSKRPLGEIASLCGYGSAVFFSRQFKAKMGCTPGEYRRSRQKNP